MTAPQTELLTFLQSIWSAACRLAFARRVALACRTELKPFT
jgi:hypothetical protein